MVYVKEHNTGYDTEYIITGTSEEVDAAVERIMSQFDPRGYNTRLIYRSPLVSDPFTIHAVVTRWNSSD